MAQKVSATQIQQYIAAVQSGGVVAAQQMYQAFLGLGYDYAGWALGVAAGSSITGREAYDFLSNTALAGVGSDACRNLTATQVDRIKIDMAQAFLNTLLKNANENGGVVEQDVTYRETEKFHSEVFLDNGLSIENWTLKVPMDIVLQMQGEAGAESMWKQIRDTQGTGLDALIASGFLADVVQGAALVATDATDRQRARDWLSAVIYPGFVDKAVKLFGDFWTTEVKQRFTELSASVSGTTISDALGRTGAALIEQLMKGPPQSGYPAAGDRDRFLNNFNEAMLLLPTSMRTEVVSKTLERAYAQWKLGVGAFAGKDWAEIEKRIQGIYGGAFLDRTLIAGIVKAFNIALKTVSPIVLDLDGNGIDLIGFDQGVNFDHDGDGFAERTGWVHGRDGLLVLDRDHNGEIDSGRELFGSETILSDGTKAVNGFHAMWELDINQDRRLDADDPRFAELRVWVDENSDGKAQSVELRSLAQVGIKSISIDHTWTQDRGKTDQYGNEATDQGSFEWVDGTVGRLVDVWFAVERSISESTVLIAETAEVAALPELPGFGVIPSLHQALLRDASGKLKGLVQAFIEAEGETERRQVLEHLLFTLAGADDKARNSRDIYIEDGRWLYVLEAITGRKYYQSAGTNEDTPNPGPNAGRVLTLAYHQYADSMYAQLMVQTRLKPFFDAIRTTVDISTGTISTDISAAMTVLENKFNAGDVDAAEIGKVLRANGQHGEEILTKVRNASAGLQGAFGTWLNSVLTLGTLGGVYRDVLVGGVSDDTILAGGGDDLIDGWDGNDTLVGGEGNDTYRVAAGAGNDMILDEEGGRDRVEFGAGISATGMKIVRAGFDLLVTFEGVSNRLTIGNWGAHSAYQIEELVFADGTVVKMADLMTRYGALQGDAGNNQLVGDNGANVLNAPDFLNASTWAPVYDPTLRDGYVDNSRGGADTLIGGAGDDVYYTTSSNGEARPFIHHPNDLGVADETIVELADGGHDTVVTTAYHETLADNVEDLVTFNAQDYFYTDSGRHIEHTYTGNALDNVIDASRLNGAVRIDGGAGADTLIGGSESSDVFVIDNVGDVVRGDKESDRWGTVDAVEASISYALTAGVENLTMTGSNATVGTGNAKNNVLDGSLNAAANTLVGGLGDDFYRVDASDVIVEKDGEGFDTAVIVSAVAGSMFKLDLAASVERLILDEAVGEVGVIGSDLNDNFAGNSKRNVLIGGAGNDVMDDGGIRDPLWGRYIVSGQDVLDGGAGDDLIYTHGDYDFITGGAGNDTISLVFDDRGSARVFFNRGDGADWLTETTVGSVDIEYGAGVDASELVMSRQGDSLELRLGTSADSMTFSQAFVDPGSEPFRSTLGTVTFAGGFELSRAEVRARFVNGNVNAVTEDGDLIIAGSGADALSGAGGDDRISAGAGDDDITGGLGNDSLYGGQGNDVYRFNVGDGFDMLVDVGGVDTLVLGAGLNEADMAVSAWWPNDLILSFGNDGIRIKDGRIEGAATTIEFVRFADGTVRDIAYLRSLEAIRGSDENDDLLGDVGNERLLGLAGNDTLDGGGGTDTLIGGLGDDTYVVDSNDDVVVEETNQGTDLLRSSVSYTLSANVENIVLTGTAPISATGNALNNKLEGNAGANRLDGGLGADAMKGGAGDDTYVVDNSGDTVTESSNQGTDKVLASVNYTLGSNMEQLELTGSSDITGTGNTLANVLIGNAGANVLTGGTGNDTMSGGLGNDTYVVDVVGDVVNENANEGIDLVQSAVNWTLGASVENLTLTGSNATNGTGNGLDNVLTGNGNANKLDGGAGNDSLVGAAGADSLTGGTGNDTLDGGAGNDTMLGGAGDDFYVVDATTDAITENASEGTDTVLTSVTLTLVANVENVTLSTGTTALSATGNASNNVMIGNAGANTLTGAAGNDTLQGGLGNDSLVGGAGADLYLFNKGDGSDTIQDSDSTSGVLDQLTFGANITRSGTTFKKVSNNLEITFTGTTTDKVVVKDWYLGAANQVERVVYADGTVMTNAQVNTAAGQPAGSSTAKTAMVKTSADRELVGTYQEWLIHTGSDSTGFDQTVTRQADALIEAMASFSGSSGMATNASLPLYTGEFRDQFAVSAR